eukprot:tig00001155_g7333.t1
MGSRAKGIATVREAPPSQSHSSRRIGGSASGRRYTQAQVDALVAVAREQGRRQALEEGREQVLARYFPWTRALIRVLLWTDKKTLSTKALMAAITGEEDERDAEPVRKDPIGPEVTGLPPASKEQKEPGTLRLSFPDHSIHQDVADIVMFAAEQININAHEDDKTKNRQLLTSFWSSLVASYFSVEESEAAAAAGETGAVPASPAPSDASCPPSPFVSLPGHGQRQPVVPKRAAPPPAGPPPPPPFNASGLEPNDVARLRTQVASDEAKDAAKEAADKMETDKKEEEPAAERKEGEAKEAGARARRRPTPGGPVRGRPRLGLVGGLGRFYIFFRLHHMLYERVLKAKEIAHIRPDDRLVAVQNAVKARPRPRARASPEGSAAC